MRRETAEKIIATMKEIDVVQQKLHEALWEIEDSEERRKMQRNLLDLVNDAHLKITKEVVKQFEDLHPDSHLFKESVTPPRRPGHAG
jgi:hypothetical protein